MARLFDNALSEYLGYAGAVISGAPCTLACWFNSDDIDASQRLITINDASAASLYRLANRGNVDGDPVDFLTIQNDASVSLSRSTGGYSANTWHHACGVAAANNDHRVYLDGGNKATDSTNIVPSALDNTRIGCENRLGGGNVNFLSGHLAEAAIWNIALTDAEVASLAKGYSPLFIHPQNLVAYWPLVRGLNDKVGGYNLTASGTVVSAHPRIIYPSGIWTPHIAAAAPPTRGQVIMISKLAIPALYLKQGKTKRRDFMKNTIFASLGIR